MDWLDLSAGNADALYLGRYYEALPNPKISVTVAAPPSFDYEQIDPTERRYEQLLGNLIATDAADTTVKTYSPIHFIPNKHVALQDGHLYLITSVTDDPRGVSKEAARVSIVPVGISRIIRLKRVDDPWGIGGKRD